MADWFNKGIWEVDLGEWKIIENFEVEKILRNVVIVTISLL